MYWFSAMLFFSFLLLSVCYEMVTSLLPTIYYLYSRKYAYNIAVAYNHPRRLVGRGENSGGIDDRDRSHGAVPGEGVDLPALIPTRSILSLRLRPRPLVYSIFIRPCGFRPVLGLEREEILSWGGGRWSV